MATTSQGRNSWWKRRYESNAGHVFSQLSVATGGIYFSVYRTDDAEIDVDGNRYAVVCEHHGRIVGTQTKTDARRLITYPDWCEPCQKLMEKRGTL